MAPRRHNIGASRRRRREEEGEDEGSIDGGVEEDSLSEGSVVSHPDGEDADGEVTDESDDEVSTSVRAEDTTNGHHTHQHHPRQHHHPQVNGGRRSKKTHPPSVRRHSASPGKRQLTTTVSDTETMMNGLRVSDDTADGPEIDRIGNPKGDRSQQTGRTPSAPPTEQRRDSLVDKKRRDLEKPAKEKEENPPFVPTRGSFFLHDKRSTESAPNGHKSSNKPKSRPYGLIVDGNVRRYVASPLPSSSLEVSDRFSHPVRTDASQGPWRHDLHDTVAGAGPPPSKLAPAANAPVNHPPKPVPVAPKSAPPNRSFSSTTLIGNVPVVVFLPGMPTPVPCASVAKKQYTRLPEHRPPLRRDKPVRISLPGQPARYILPATERSFIFIPRALRPNQQAYRGRGRGGFYGGGRRPSFYAGSTYAPSVAMSRRSSLGKPPSHEGYPSPAGSMLSRQTMVAAAAAAAESNKPVVRLPPPHRPPGGLPPATTAGPGAVPPVGPPALPHPPPQHPAYRESRPAPIPMHQPRPQKTVSVADIETPASFPYNPPQPQAEPPFHHQVPAPASGPGYGPDASGPPSMTPLSQIPERAIHAQPFQPHAYPPMQPYYPPGYPGGGVYYPGPGTEYAPYPAGVGPGTTSVPPFAPGQPTAPYMGPATHAPADQPTQPGTVAHEAGGTVYFYDAAQLYPNAQYGVPAGAGPGGVVGMGGMMTPPGATYYYPPGPGGATYYGTQ